MPNAINMAAYAAKRTINAPPLKGNLIQDLLGAPSENDPDTLQFASSKYDFF